MGFFVPPGAGGEEIHVWCSRLDDGRENLPFLAALLAPDEQARAKRYHFERDRSRFIMRRGFLRLLLGAYLDRDPASLQFSYGSNGKPALRPGSSVRPLQFNLSHSNGLAVYALSRDRPVGIDLEHVRSLPEVAQIAWQFFTPLERNWALSSPVEDRMERFFLIWTGKEAYLKATGEGLMRPSTEIEVFFDEREAMQIRAVHTDQLEIGRWRMEMIRNIPGYLAAVVGEGQDWQLNFRYLSTVRLGGCFRC
jgi:4'-phosphopantetheinyl transferase